MLLGMDGGNKLHSQIRESNVLGKSKISAAQSSDMLVGLFRNLCVRWGKATQLTLLKMGGQDALEAG